MLPPLTGLAARYAASLLCAKALTFDPTSPGDGPEGSSSSAKPPESMRTKTVEDPSPAPPGNSCVVCGSPRVTKMLTLRWSTQCDVGPEIILHLRCSKSGRVDLSFSG